MSAADISDRDDAEPADGPAAGADPALDAATALVSVVGSAPPLTDIAAERGRAAEILDIAAGAARLGVAIDAGDAIARGLDPKALRAAVLDRAAAVADASAVVTTAPAPRTAAGPVERKPGSLAAAARAQAARTPTA